VGPFLLDQTEFTVQRFRLQVLSGALSGAEMPTLRDPQASPYCTWLGVADTSNDDKPLNCVHYETASRACQVAGGALPTEAQWEHAARGRGERRRYPWGNQDPECCLLSAGRPPPDGNDCPSMGSGVESAGSHRPTPSCGGRGDESRDGVLDMAGSLAEALQDELRDYTDPCWGRGILRDPVCTTASPSVRAAREISWSAGLADAWLVLRRGYQSSGTPQEGFRCAYEGGSR
jgi:formylglycine-generating enzyme required for sulfatase activity